jgi:hypothetical protein
MHVPIRDPRYTTVRILIEDHKINRITDIFKYIPPSVVAKDMHTNITALENKFAHLWQFTIGDIYRLAEIIDCDFHLIFHIISDEVIRLNNDRK